MRILQRAGTRRMELWSLIGICAVCLLALGGHPAASGAGLGESLSQDLSRIFASADLNARFFGPARWDDKVPGTYLTVEPSAGNGAARDLVRYNAANGERSVVIAASALVPPGASEPLRIEQYAFSPDGSRALIFTNSRKVWRQNTRGDFWVFNLATKAAGGALLRKLGGNAPESTLMFAKFSPDGKRVAYVRASNLYVEDIDSGTITPLTTDGTATSINGTSDWVYEEELALRDAFRWSPDSTHIAYWHFDASGVGIYPLVNNTISLYPQITLIPYPKAGTTNSAVTVGVVSASGGPTTWISDLPGDPRQHYIARMDWAANARELVIQRLNRLQNENDLVLADATTGKSHNILTEKDDAWVDVDDEFTWIDKGQRFLWLSDRDGWQRLYAVTRDGSKLTPLTSANADVIRVVAVDPKGEWVYYLAAPTNATQRQLLRVRTDGSAKPEILSKVPGTHNYQISADATWAIHSFSTFDQPPVTDLIKLPSHEVVRVLQDNATLRQNAAPLLAAKSEFFTVDVGDGVTLDGWMLRPPDFDPAKKYPTLVYVYGEPAGVTVTDSWGAKRELFHRALARDGFVVVSFDNRGTPSPKGRAWRKVVYGAVGVHSSKEQAAAIRAFAASHPFVDMNRLAVWGWSGGGSNTLNLMFRSNGLYKVGIAVAPVPDQRLYDTIYQERYMGLPGENAEGYKKGSPINFADGLQGRLLVIHGSGDDNVHIQGSEMLANRLIELGKPFDFFVYPGRTHAIDEGAGTSLDIHSRIARYLKEHLLDSAGSN